MKIWVDDVRPAPEGYQQCKSVASAKCFIRWCEKVMKEDEELGFSSSYYKIELIDIDHDAGEYVKLGGNYIKLLEWLEETGRSYPIHIHSDNQINLLWMREIIERNGWKEV